MKDFNSRPEDYYSVGPNKQVIDIINDEIGDIGEYYFSVGNYIKYKVGRLWCTSFRKSMNL